jgi:hypothetical protein
VILSLLLQGENTGDAHTGLHVDWAVRHPGCADDCADVMRGREQAQAKQASLELLQADKPSSGIPDLGFCAIRTISRQGNELDRSTSKARSSLKQHSYGRPSLLPVRGGGLDAGRRASAVPLLALFDPL